MIAADACDEAKNVNATDTTSARALTKSEEMDIKFLEMRSACFAQDPKREGTEGRAEQVGRPDLRKVVFPLVVHGDAIAAELHGIPPT